MSVENIPDIFTAQDFDIEGDGHCEIAKQANAAFREYVKKLERVYFIKSVPSPFMHRESGYPGDDTTAYLLFPTEIKR